MNVGIETGNGGIVKACEDIDECSDGQSDCDQVISSINIR